MERKIFIAGPELGSDKGKILIVQRGLYWLKFWEVAFWSFYGEIWHDTEYKSSWADQDVWLCPATSKDTFEYFEYIFVCVDDYMFLKSSLRGWRNEVKIEWQL